MTINWYKNCVSTIFQYSNSYLKLFGLNWLSSFQFVDHLPGKHSVEQNIRFLLLLDEFFSPFFHFLFQWTRILFLLDLRNLSRTELNDWFSHPILFHRLPFPKSFMFTHFYFALYVLSFFIKIKNRLSDCWDRVVSKVCKYPFSFHWQCKLKIQCFY